MAAKRSTTDKNAMKHRDLFPHKEGGSFAFSKLLEYAMSLNPKFDAKRYLNFGEDIVQTAEKVFSQIKSFQAAISEMPYLALVMVWASSIREDRVFGERYILMMK